MTHTQHMKNNKTSKNSKTTNAKTIRGHLAGQDQASGVLSIFCTGAEVSANELRAAGISNPSAVISRLRSEGYEIFSNARRTVTGTVNKWRLNDALVLKVA